MRSWCSWLLMESTLPLVRRSSRRRCLTNDAAETDMTCRGVHRLRMTRGRAVTAAVIWCTQVRTTLQYLPRDPDFRLARVITQVFASSPRIDRNAADLVGIAVVLG